MEQLEQTLKLVTTIFVFCAVLCAGNTAVVADHHIDNNGAIIRYNTLFHPKIGSTGMVVSQRQQASEIGVAILKKGGNAVDAAVAVAMALAVNLPRAGNIGGGGFMIVHLAKEQKTIAIDYREMAPELATRDMYLDSDGNIDKQKERFSHLSAGVPGTVAGMWYAHSQYGVLPWAEVLAPAIYLAENGFAINYDLADNLKIRHKWLTSNPAAASIFYKNNHENHSVGEKLVQKDLAKTLKTIAKQGRDGFYKGYVAQQIAAEMRANGGIITEKDLANYKVRIRDVVTSQYRKHKIVSMPPASSGGAHVLQMLNILENFNLKKAGYGSAKHIHLMAESMKLAYRDRYLYMGDSDFHQVPLTGLTQQTYADKLAKTINLKKAGKVSSKSRYQPFVESPDTTHFSIVDKYGNAVANTYTLNFSFGSGIVVPNAGFLLNNEMADFAASVGKPDAFGMVGGKGNAIQPGKRPLSSMTPLMVFDPAGKLFVVTGSPGGSRIITTVLQVVLNVIDFEMNIAEATLMPRVHHQWRPDKLQIEPGFSPDTLAILKKKGHRVTQGNTMGSVQSIMLKDGKLYGASDTRRPGAGAVAIND